MQRDDSINQKIRGKWEPSGARDPLCLQAECRRIPTYQAELRGWTLKVEGFHFDSFFWWQRLKPFDAHSSAGNMMIDA